MHVLPDEVREAFTKYTNTELRNSYIVALRRLGWTLQSIAGASGITRERVRQIAKDDKILTQVVYGLPLPTPPMKPERPKPTYVEPSEATLKRLLELQPLAQQVRSNSPKYREEAEEYTQLLNYAHTEEGVTLYRLAKRLGVTHGALRFRLARYGLKEFGGDSRVYKPILEKNRVH